MPLPPTLKRPKRLKGAEQIQMLDVTFLMTVTRDGSGGMSLEVIVQSEDKVGGKLLQRDRIVSV